MPTDKCFADMDIFDHFQDCLLVSDDLVDIQGAECWRCSKEMSFSRESFKVLIY